MRSRGVSQGQERGGKTLLIIGKRVNHGKLYGAVAGKEEGQRGKGNEGKAWEAIRNRIQ